VELELEVEAEQAQVKDLINLAWIKASPSASNPILEDLLNFV
jgi:hypothetical protein